MYQGPSGPFAALVHVVVRRPIVGVIIAVFGLFGTISMVDHGPLGPGVHGGSESVLEAAIDQLEKKDPQIRARLAIYEQAFEDAKQQRNKPLSDEHVQYILDHYKATGLTVGDVRANEDLEEAIEKAYFFDLIHKYNGKLDFATANFVNKP
jgi:hypothetical protein